MAWNTEKQKHNLPQILLVMELHERSISSGEYSELLASRMDTIFGSDRNHHTRKPSGIAWSIDYAELIERSKNGRENLSNYLTKEY